MKITPKFSPKSFIVLALKFRALIHFELIILCAVNFFACGYLVVQAPFFEKTVLVLQ